jgi:RNA-directed DNA polymerase
MQHRRALERTLLPALSCSATVLRLAREQAGPAELQRRHRSHADDDPLCTRLPGDGRPWPTLINTYAEVAERMIPKTGGKLRRLGIPTARDRVVQAALKLVLEPIFEADFRPCSHGFRPGRRAHDAIAEIHHLTSVRYEWVLEGDITACFDEIDHTALMDRVRRRIGDKRVLGLVKAFLKAGVLSEDDIFRDTDTGTPQGGILSPLLANIALSVLDDHFAEAWQNEMASTWQRRKRRQQGRPNYRLIRYADDFVVVIHGDRADAAALRDEIAAVLAPAGLRLSETKMTIAHIDEGFDFLGIRIQRHLK